MRTTARMIARSRSTRTGRERHSEVNDWATPRWLYDALSERIPFDVDACATAADALCPVWIPDEFAAMRMGDDGGLAGRSIWMNPPYGRALEWWVGWALQARQWNGAERVVCLLPVRTSTGWWHAHIPWALQVVYIRGQLRFGGSRVNAPFDSALVVFGRAPTIAGITALQGRESVAWGVDNA